MWKSTKNGLLLLPELTVKFAAMIMAIEHSGIAITTEARKTKLLDVENDGGKAGSILLANFKWLNGNLTTVTILGQMNNCQLTMLE